MRIINTSHLAAPAQSSVKRAVFLAVLTCGIANDFAVYTGIVNLPDSDSTLYEESREAAANWIAYHGAKQSYRRALTYFPNLEESEYRA